MKTQYTKRTLGLLTSAIFAFTVVNAQLSEFYGLTENGGKCDLGTIYKTDENGNNLQVVSYFPASDLGAGPMGKLCEANSGKLYGMTRAGGANNKGVIFEWDPAANTYSKKLDFNGSENGSFPESYLVAGNNGKLYGMTVYGGSFDLGIIFEWDPATNFLVKKFEFTGQGTGWYTLGPMTMANNGKFYGMTYYGGTDNEGVIFEWDPATNLFTKKMDFKRDESGCNPRGSFLEADNGKLYGTTSGGGANDKGLLFEWDIAANTFTKKLDFSSETGGNSSGALMRSSNGRFYGATESVIYEWEPVSNAFTKIYEFNYSIYGGANGSAPLSPLIQADNGNLFGITLKGGDHDSGVLFELDPVSGTYYKKFDFSYLENGSRPNLLMKATNGKIYLTTENGLSTTSEGGAVFEFDPATGLCIKKFGFPNNSPYGSNPCGHLIQADNGKLYGLSSSGGYYNEGVLFEWNPYSNTYTKKIDFRNVTIGRNPFGSLVQASNGKLYGMTLNGGIYDDGVLFEWDPFTNNCINKLDFKGSENGSNPLGSLIQAENGKLYGMTSAGGLYGNGVLFEWDPATNIFIKRLDFDGANGRLPTSALVQAGNGKLYGMTKHGGVHEAGVLFEWDPITNIYVKKLELDGKTGIYPSGSLIQGNCGNLYGMTDIGSSFNNNYGVLFEWDPATNTISKLWDFKEENGSRPVESLLQAYNEKLYGTASSGGMPPYGELFEWDLATKTYSKKVTYNGANGGVPSGALIEVKKLNSVDTVIKVDLLKGLIAYYPFNGNANDESGNGHHGTINGGIPANDRAGRPGGAYTFTGEKNTLSFSGYQFMNPRITICGWVRITDANADTVLYSNSSSLTVLLRIVNRRYQAELSFAGKKVILGDENGLYEIDPQKPGFDFLILTYDGSQIKFGINDQFVGCLNRDERIIMPLFPLTVMTDINYSFHGILDEFRIYNRNFSDEEIFYLRSDTYTTNPDIVTDSVTNIGKNTATVLGRINFLNGRNILKFGVCFGLSPEPDTTNLQLVDDLIYNDTLIHIKVTGLVPNTTYYVRMIAISTYGITYCNVLSFTTLPEPSSFQTPDVLAFSKDTFEMPVIANNLKPDEQVLTFHFDCSYDVQKLEFQGYSREATLAEDGDLRVDQLPDKLSVTWAGLSQSEGAGKMIDLKFRALEAGSTVPVLTNCLFNSDTVRNIVNGMITIEGQPTGISDPSGTSIEMYPNPANTVLYFRNLTGEAEINIYDLQGRVLISKTITDNRVDLSVLDFGIYTVHIRDAKSAIIRKLIKL